MGAFCMYKQILIINKMNELGYNADVGGVCFGISHMLSHAIFLGERKQYEDRIRLIITTPNLKEKIEATKLKSRRKITLSKEDRAYLDVLSFFDGIMMYQVPENYTQWFSKNIVQINAFSVLPFLEPLSLANAGGVGLIYSGPGIYTEFELSSYLKKISDLIKTCENSEKIALQINSEKHAMLLSYDLIKCRWHLFDPNQLLKPSVSEQDIAKEIMNAYRETPITAFETKIYTTNANLKNNHEKFNVLKDISEHKVDETKAKMKTIEQVNLLLLAAQYGHMEVIKKLLEFHSDINSLNQGGLSALHFAANSGHIEIVNYLLEKGIIVNPTIPDGINSALHFAAQGGHVEVIKALLKKDALVNYKNANGETPLDFAAKTGAFEVVKLLLDNGAAVDLKSEEEGYQSLNWAAEGGHFAIVKRLIQFVQTENLNANGFACAFDFAIKKRHFDIAKLFLENNVFGRLTLESKTAALHAAAENGHIELVEYLLDKGTAIDATSKTMDTSLHYAAKSGNLQLVKFFLEKNPNIYLSKNIEGHMALHIAAQYGHVAIVTALLGPSYLKHIEKNDIFETFRLAAENGHLDTLKALLEENVFSNKLEIFSDTSVLYRAVKMGHLHVVEFLLDQPEMLSALQAKDDFSVFHVAAENADIDLVEFFLKKTASLLSEKDIVIALGLAARKGYLNIVNALYTKINFSELDKELQMLIYHLAAEKESLEIVQHCFKQSTMVDNISEDNAVLYLASENGNPEIVDFLLEKMQIKTETGSQALYIASKYGHVNIVKKLMEYNPSFINVNEEGHSPLHIAAEMGHLSVVEYLLEKNPFLAIDTTNLGTALHLAAKEGHVDVINALLNKTPTAIIDIADRAGFTALHRAVQEGQSFAVETLLRQGASVNILTMTKKERLTALHLAVKNNNLFIVNTLLSVNPKIINDVTGKKATALHLAIENGFFYIVKALLENGASTTIKNAGNKTALELATEKTPPNLEIQEILLQYNSVTTEDNAKRELTFSFNTKKDATKNNVTLGGSSHLDGGPRGH
jgi:ankyrin repeat protein